MNLKEVNRAEIVDIDCGVHNIIVGRGCVEFLKEYILASRNEYSKLFILADKNTAKYCVDLVASKINISQDHVIIIDPGEQSKSPIVFEKVVNHLANNGADRNALLISVGGGVVCDLSAFVASVYKRGVKCLHIPTSLLGMIDAGIGAKNGINVNGIKNVAGTFYPPEVVLVDPEFLSTLPKEEWLNGYAEMIKHALIKDPGLLLSVLKISQDPAMLNEVNDQLVNIIEESIQIKSGFVKKDPNDFGARQALNFGHTIGHAIETASSGSNQPLSHGRSVIAGIFCELYISKELLSFDETEFRSITDKLLRIYGTWPLTAQFKDAIISNLNFDKKRVGEEIVMTLLEKIGSPIIGRSVSISHVNESLDYYIGLR